MKARYTVTFDGVAEKAAGALEKMLRDDIAGYPARLAMTGASVEPAESPPKAKKEKADAKP